MSENTVRIDNPTRSSSFSSCFALNCIRVSLESLVPSTRSLKAATEALSGEVMKVAASKALLSEDKPQYSSIATFFIEAVGKPVQVMTSGYCSYSGIVIVAKLDYFKMAISDFYQKNEVWCIPYSQVRVFREVRNETL